MSSGRSYNLTEQDYQDILREAPHVRAAAPVLSRLDIREVSAYNNSNGEVSGVPPHYNVIRYWPLADGRWFDQDDESQKRLVAVLGDEMMKNLYSGRQAVGTTILLNGIRFEVIGVVQRVGHGDDNSTNNRVFMPFSTMRQFFPLTKEGQEDAVSFINYRPRIRQEHAQAREEVRKIIARNHGFDWHDEDAFEDWDTIKNSETVGKIFDAMDLFLGGVGLVTLTLGAIGIINIMLVSVTERTREIGLRKALGATHRAIMTQFFVEGAFLTALSGGIGLAITTALVAALAALPAPEGFDTPRIVPSSAAIAIFSLALAGIVAGLYPARQAALLPPVEALRQE
jgi:putative ABC transport system permease protein